MKYGKLLILSLLFATLLCCVFLLSSCEADSCANGHTEVTDEAVAATCTSDGKTKGSHCSVCNTVLTEQETIPALGHSSDEWVTDLAATCTTDGSKHMTCTVCEEIFAIERITAQGHVYDEWTTKLASTCEQLGEENAVCTVCKKAQTRSIPRAAHTAGATIPYIDPSCTSLGCRYVCCADCDVILELEVLPSLGHNFTTESDPSCETEGVAICSRCEKTELEATPATGHTEGAWITDLLPTCTSIGCKYQICSSCEGVINLTTLPATGHTEGDWETVLLPTASTSGKMAKFCIECRTELDAKSTSSQGNAVTFDEHQALNLLNFSLLYHAAESSLISEIYQSQIESFAAKLSAATGLPFTPLPDTVGAVGIKQILIGLTDCELSKEAYNAIQGKGFAIRVTENAIAIAGSNDLCTLAGLQYFTDIYLSTFATPSVTLSLSSYTAANNITMSVVCEPGGTTLPVVIDSGLRSDTRHAYVASSTSDSRDYVCLLTEEFIELLARNSQLTAADFSQITDDTTVYPEVQKELLFGHVDREETKAFLATLDANEYGIHVTDDKVIVTSHTDQGLKKAMEVFLTLHAYAALEMSFGLPSGFTYTGVTDSSWIVDFPRPEAANISLYNAQYQNDGGLQFLYTGTGVNAAAFNAYCDRLIAAGYTLVSENTIEQNRFASFVNTQEGILLYVGYNAFAHEDEARYKDESTHILSQSMSPSNGEAWTSYHPFYDYEACIRIVSEPTDRVNRPDATLLNKQSYTKVCNSAISTIRLQDNAVGMCYIITLEDGRFVVIDGGNAVGDATTLLWNTLVNLHTEVNGALSTSNPIHLAAWYVTHSHGDHYGNFKSMLSTYGKTGNIKIDYLLGNFPEASVIYPVSGSTLVMGSSSERATMQNSILGGFTYVKLRTGDKIYLANLEMEVLMTYEDHNPRRIDNSNDTNTVSRLTLTHKNSSNETTWVILGDSCVYQSRFLCVTYGDYLQSDMVQLAHHGNIGSEIALYKTIQPTVVWYPHNSKGYNSWSGSPTSTKWPYNVSNYVVKDLASVKYIYVSGIYGVSGYEGLTLPFDDSGTPIYDGIYNPYTGGALSYNVSTSTTLPYKVETSHAIKKEEEE